MQRCSHRWKSVPSAPKFRRLPNQTKGLIRTALLSVFLILSACTNGQPELSSFGLTLGGISFEDGSTEKDIPLSVSGQSIDSLFGLCDARIGSLEFSIDNGDWQNPNGTNQTGSRLALDVECASDRRFEVKVEWAALNPPDDDVSFERTLRIRGLTILGYTRPATARFVYTKSVPSLRFTSSDLTVAESVGTVTVAVRMSDPVLDPVTFTVSNSAGSAQTADHDFTTQALTMTAGEVERFFTFSVTDDLLHEGNETFVMALQAPSGYGISTPHTLTVTIVDDDSEPILSLAGGNSGPETDPSLVFTVNLSSESGLGVGFSWKTVDGTATAGSDYVATPLTNVTLAAGETQALLTVGLLNLATDRDEDDETFTVVLQDLVNATSGTLTAQGTLIDMDTPPSLQFTTASQSLGEGAGSATAEILLSEASGRQVQVSYTVGGTATGGGVDYTLAAGTVTFAAGITSQTLTITFNDDTLAESAETVVVGLTSPLNATLGATNLHTVTLLDNDLLAAPAHVSFGNWNDYVKKGADTTTPTYKNSTVVSCNPAVDPSVCEHAGEMRKVSALSFTSCTGLTLQEELAAFNWVCDDSSGSVAFYSDRLASGQSLRSILTSGSFSQNRVWMWKSGVVVGQADLAPTWDNDFHNLATTGVAPSEYLSGGTLFGKTNPILWAGANLTLSGMIHLDSKTSLVTLNGATLSVSSLPYDITTSNCNYSVTLDGAAVNGTNKACLVGAKQKDFLWIEADIDANYDSMSTTYQSFAIGLIGTRVARILNTSVHDANTASHRGLLLVNTRFVEIADSSVESAKGGCVEAYSGDNLAIRRFQCDQTQSDGILLRETVSSLLDTVTVSNMTGINGIHIWKANNTVATGLSVSSADYGLRLTGAANITVRDSEITDTNRGILLTNADQNRIENVRVSRAANKGIELNSGSDLNVLDNVQVQEVWAGGGIGIDVLGSYDNRLRRIVIANAHTHGLRLGGSYRTHVVGLKSFGNGAGIVINNSANTYLSQIMATHSWGNALFLNDADNSAFNQISILGAMYANPLYPLPLDGSIKYTTAGALYGSGIASQTATGTQVNTGLKFHSVFIYNTGGYGMLLNGMNGVQLERIALSDTQQEDIAVYNSSNVSFLSRVAHSGTFGQSECRINPDSTTLNFSKDATGGHCKPSAAGFVADRIGSLWTSFIGLHEESDPGNTHITTTGNDWSLSGTLIDDWLNFGSSWRTWGERTTTFDPADSRTRGRCSATEPGSAGGYDCRVYDFGFRTDATTTSTLYSSFSPGELGLLNGDPCPSWATTSVESSAFDTTAVEEPVGTKYLVYAVESDTLGTGDHDGICEHGHGQAGRREVCYLSPLIGYYQGEGTDTSVSCDMGYPAGQDDLDMYLRPVNGGR